MQASRALHDIPADEDLVRQVAVGSEEALSTLYDRHAATAFRAALRLDRDPGVAEEVVQETFLALWDRAEQFDPTRGSLAAWLTTIARNRAIDRRRATARRLNAEPFSVVVADQPDEAAAVDWLMASGSPVGAAAPELPPDVALDLRDTQAAVAGAVAVLSEEERQTILLAYRDGLSQSEIAVHLGWPIGTVKTRSRRALRRLRDVLEAPTHAGEARPAPAHRGSSQAVATLEPCAGCG